jgi:hypothetical protein
MMVNVALLALLLSFVNAIVLRTSEDMTIVEGVLDRIHAWGPFLTALVLSLLFDLFLAIPRYYLQRLRILFERDAIHDLFAHGLDEGKIRPLRSEKTDDDRRD